MGEMLMVKVYAMSVEKEKLVAMYLRIARQLALVKHVYRIFL